MLARHRRIALFASAALLGASSPALAQDFHFSTGAPDGLLASASRPDGPSGIEIESADDFVLTQETAITNGAFTGLVPANSTATNLIVEIYRVFPLDSTVPPSGNVTTRSNSPSDVALTTRDASLGELVYSTATLNPTFTTANSVINGINPLPGEFTGGEGPVTGQEITFSFSFSSPLDLLADHYFFVPQVELSDGTFLWLSAARPIVAPGTPFPAGTTDLQSWIRNENLSPDWLRIGTDITHQGPFNAVFSLDGHSVPEPASWTMMIAGFAALGLALRRRQGRPAVA